MHGTEVGYYKKMFQTVENIIHVIEKDEISKYLLLGGLYRMNGQTELTKEHMEMGMPVQYQNVYN